MSPRRFDLVGADGYGASMDSDDVVDSIDAALQELLAMMAERTDDLERHDALVDHILLIPPFREWPAESRTQLHGTCKYVVGLANELRQRQRDASEENDATPAEAYDEPGREAGSGT